MFHFFQSKRGKMNEKLLEGGRHNYNPALGAEAGAGLHYLSGCDHKM